MNRVAALSDQDRALVFEETSARRNIAAPIVEKDFWVCWMLGILFGHHEWREVLLFKGGTALSKVFGLIRRFSEDIDLSISPGRLGISEVEVESAVSRKQRDEWMRKLETVCRNWVTEDLQPHLEETVTGALGPEPNRSQWLRFEIEEATHSPVLHFHYPSVLPAGMDYIARRVKLEFGSLTDQRPTGRHRVRPWLAEVVPDWAESMACEVVALEAERAFWEKATILHAEFHRAASSPLPSRYSRHYSDVAAMATTAVAQRALEQDELRQRVVEWKSRFFSRSWASYETARPGSFRLRPPKVRHSELESDYRAMRLMFLEEPPSFSDMLQTLGGLEDRLNCMP
jgi:hypothetical protein